MSDIPLVNLFDEAEADIVSVMSAPWRGARVTSLDVDERLELRTEGEEHCVFVVDGALELVSGDGRTYSFTDGSAFSLPIGGSATLSATSPARMLVLTMAVAGH